MPSVILCAKQTKAFLQGAGSLAQFLPTARRAQKYPRRISIVSACPGQLGYRRYRGQARAGADHSGRSAVRVRPSRELRRSLTVCAPSFASFSPVTLPTPGKRPTGNGSRNASMSSGWMTKSPSGLRQSEASFAKNLFGATPAEAVRFNSSRICCRIVRATRVAVAKPVLFSVTSRYASSRDSGSIRSV